MAEKPAGFAGGLVVHGLAGTEALARRIAAGLAVGDTVALEGDLGAGKTTLARAILRALGETGEVPSPSFTLVQHYETPRLTIAHCDLYRIEDPAEVDELGLEDALDQGAVLIEWPDRAPARIPNDALTIRIGILGEQDRAMQFCGPARWAHVLANGKD
ncbi:MAG TPA: tRNA (adenosine(37)-N6)-threonylcarbamoyltransferase complex ATPase subunit type 1 TsaE [Rhizomicrobium sp.]|jgi:tRNA threonylcarbamoyl adenosine modification protein YjeE|nr:tRNA (adenosine(37)-N6)-threonylcarbamoyltransferase complex ATPase subunit type 1 TsaE [Rhizomicrobium sp.]